LQGLPSQAVTTWNWSFTSAAVNPDQFASGTFTTADVTPTAFTTYSILDIDGTFFRNGITYSITGLSSLIGASNTFQWDGTALSPVISDYDGISFFVSSSNEVNFYSDDTGYNAVDETYTDFPGTDPVISSSTLTPVPGPLPLFGAATAYSWSRRMRRRIAEKA
jgi:hypothetical protein